MAFVSFAFRIKFKGEDLGVIDADDVTMDQALQLEDQASMTLQQLIRGLGDGSAKAIQAAVWFQLLRIGRPQPLHQNFRFGDFDVEAVTPVDPTLAAAAAEESPSPSKSGGGKPSRSLPSTSG